MTHTPTIAAPERAAARAARRRSPRWLGAWARERFPARNGVFYAVFYATALLVGRASATTGPVGVGPRDAAGLLALTAFFLVLRVLDEHKDFAADLVAHPRRVLQRGLVTLGMLRTVGAAAVAAQLAVMLWHDGGAGAATRWWLAAAGWSALMAREFFAPAWLRRRTMIYALTHMAVMPLLAAWVAALGAPAAPHEPAVHALAALAFAAGLAVEITRKLRAPADEHPMADSYTRALGVRGATVAAVAALLAAVAAAAAVVWFVERSLPWWSVTAPGLATLVAARALLAFAVAPSARGAKRAEVTAGLAVVAGHAAVIAAVLVARGVRLP